MTGPGIRLALRVTPKARRDAVTAVESGQDGPKLRVKVCAPPEKGKANAAVITVLAEMLDVPKSAITLIMGETGRDKLAFIVGDPNVLAARIEALRSKLEEQQR